VTFEILFWSHTHTRNQKYTHTHIGAHAHTPYLPQKLVHNPRGFFEVTVAADAVPDFVVVDEFAHFKIEGRLLYLQFVKT